MSPTPTFADTAYSRTAKPLNTCETAESIDTHLSAVDFNVGASPAFKCILSTLGIYIHILLAKA